MSQNQTIDNQINSVILNDIIYTIDEEEKTAEIVDTNLASGDVFIPRSIYYKSQEYVITSIQENAFNKLPSIKSIQFSEDSEIQSICNCAFNNSSIESISIPSSLIELKEGWCEGTSKLTHINVMPDNPRYSIYNNEMILGKSEPEKENYDILVISVRNIETVKIPEFIEIIGSCAFNECKYIQKFEFLGDPKLRIIEKDAFSSSSIESFTIPPHLTRICEGSFSFCRQLNKFEIPFNSELCAIGKYAFCGSPIESILIPSKLVELENKWCQNTQKLNKINVMPRNKRYSLFDEKFIIAKSSIENEKYDTLAFSIRKIKKVTIPSFIEVIGSCAFDFSLNLKEVKIPSDSNLIKIGSRAFFISSIEKIDVPPHLTSIGKFAFYLCEKLRKFDIPTNSKLQRIGKYAFSNSLIECIYMPSHLSQIGEYAFFFCGLKIIEIDEDSKLKSKDFSVFFQCENALVMIPEKLNNHFDFTDLVLVDDFEN